jgi:hypothetical protein
MMLRCGRVVIPDRPADTARCRAALPAIEAAYSDREAWHALIPDAVMRVTVRKVRGEARETWTLVGGRIVSTPQLTAYDIEMLDYVHGPARGPGEKARKADREKMRKWAERWR